MALPTFFIIGAAKCGTTTLYRHLARHDDFHMSPVKEPAYFVPPDPRRPFGLDHVGDAQEYERLFASDKPFRGEASPQYSMHSYRAGTPQLIRAAVPEARFVYLVRDPVDRIVSHYHQVRRVGGYEGPMAPVVGDIEHPDNPFVCPSRYATQIDQYDAVFDPDRLLVVDLADLAQQPLATLNTVCAFLGAPPFTDIRAERHNATGQEREHVRLLARARHSPSLRAAADALPDVITRPLAAGARRVLSRAPRIEAPPQDLLGRLRAHLAPEADRLRRRTGQQFATWSV